MSRNVDSKIVMPGPCILRTRSRRRPAVRLVLLLACAVPLSACSDIYFDRRESVAFHTGDAVASNITVQTVDPWPRYAGNRNLAINGERMYGAIERYRTNRVTPLVTTSTSSVHYQSTQQGPASAAPASNGTTP